MLVFIKRRLLASLQLLLLLLVSCWALPSCAFLSLRTSLIVPPATQNSNINNNRRNCKIKKINNDKKAFRSQSGAAVALSVSSGASVTTTATALSSSNNDNDNNTSNKKPTMKLPAPLTTKVEKVYTGKTVLLTGATGGLGQALALQLAQWKVKKLVISGRKKDALEVVANECRALYPNIQMELVVCDLAKPSSVQAAASQVSTLDIDILINNGGVASRSRFLDTTVDVDAQIMQINFLSGAALAKSVVPGMVKRKAGKIIWVSSVQGLIGIPNRSSYAASKFAVQGYMESIRAELKSSGISVHTVSPGYMRTNLSQGAITGDGKAYGKTDATTAAGEDPQIVAQQLLERVAAGEVEFTVAAGFSTVVAILLRFFFPGILRMILVKRYEKGLIKDKED